MVISFRNALQSSLIFSFILTYTFLSFLTWCWRINNCFSQINDLQTRTAIICLHIVTFYSFCQSLLHVILHKPNSCLVSLLYITYYFWILLILYLTLIFKITSYCKLHLWCKYVINSCWLYAVATCKNHYVIFVNNPTDELIQGQIMATKISVMYSYEWKSAFHNAQANICLRNLTTTEIKALHNLYRIISLLWVVGFGKVIICVCVCAHAWLCVQFLRS